MKSYLVLGIICVFLAVLVTGCTQPVTLPVTTPPTTAVPATLPPTPAPTNDPSLLLKSATWSLSSMVKNSTTVPILPGTIITAKFTADSVDGVAGCNNYFASYTVSGNTMTIGPVGSTRMFCGEPAGLMAQENAYIGMLQTAATYSVTATELIISDAGGNNQLVYQKYQPPGITGKWQLDSIGQGSTVSRIIAGTNITAVFASDGNLTGSAGCNNYFTRFRVEADGVTITSPIGTTLMFCSEPGGVMTQESTYLSILQNVTKYSTINNQLNLMDEGGKNTLFFIAMQG